MSNKFPPKIAITGASGFIGRHILRELARHPVEIIAVTRSAARLIDWGTNIGIVEMDLSHPCLDCFEQIGRPDILIHLAWEGLSNYRSFHHFETELPRQYFFLKTMIEAGLSSLLVTGTCFEYGLQSGPLAENLPTRPINSYGYAKDALRQQLQILHANRPFAFTWARLFYMYGEGQHESSLYSKLKEAVLRGDKSFNMSGGEQLRDYSSIEEVARLIVLLALQRCDRGVINVCAGKPISVRSLVEKWIEENGWDIKLNLGHYSYPDYEPMAFWGDRSHLDSILENL